MANPIMLIKPCAYEQNGRHAVAALRSENLRLRQDVDNLLVAVTDLKRSLGVLRVRVDFNEMVAP